MNTRIVERKNNRKQNNEIHQSAGRTNSCLPQEDASNKAKIFKMIVQLTFLSLINTKASSLVLSLQK